MENQDENQAWSIEVRKKFLLGDNNSVSLKGEMQE